MHDNVIPLRLPPRPPDEHLVRLLQAWVVLSQEDRETLALMAERFAGRAQDSLLER